MGPLILLIWNSGDVSFRFQRQSGQTYSHLGEGVSPPAWRHPSGHCSGRYASYWNAFLFYHVSISLTDEMKSDLTWHEAKWRMNNVNKSIRALRCYFAQTHNTFQTHLQRKQKLSNSLLPQGNVFTPVCHSVQGGCPPLVRGGVWHTPPGRQHPWADTPPGRHQSPWVDTLLPSACWDTHPCPAHAGIHPPAQCMLGYGQQVGGTHPTGMHSCFTLSIRTSNPIFNLYWWKWIW